MSSPATEPFGIDEWVNLAIVFINFYLRHKPAIDEVIGTDLASSMEKLAEAYNLIKSLNPFGPQ